jgi:hypothetical protein
MYGTGINEIRALTDTMAVTLIKTTFRRKDQIYLAIAG